jgi:hypothetical protein
MILRALRTFILSLFCCITGLTAFAQSGTDTPTQFASPGQVCVPGKEPLLFTPYYHYGFIIAHHPEMQYLTKGHVQIGELSITRPTYGKSYWNQLFNFPEPGIAFFFFDLGNPQNLGNLYSICPFIDFPFNKGTRTRFCLRAGGGMSYLTKPFDPVTNYKDIAIGSHFNGFVNIRLTLKEQITQRLRMDLGVSFSHTSNGAFKTPNLGLNMPTLCAGLGYSINPCPPPQHADTLPKCDRQRFYGITVAGAISQINPPGGHYYGATIVSANMYRRWNHKNLWNVGLEFFYNEANYQEIVRSDASITRSHFFQPAAKIGYALCVGRISVPIELGVYFYDKVNGETVPMYQHIGLRYQISDRFLIGTELKTYFARAEFFEWGITYRFIHKRCADSGI